jgi:hypothetical protein
MQYSPNKNSNSIRFYGAKRNSFAVFRVRDALGYPL